jgi:hypothetical protein
MTMLAFPLGTASTDHTPLQGVSRAGMQVALAVTTTSVVVCAWQVIRASALVPPGITCHALARAKSQSTNRMTMIEGLSSDDFDSDRWIKRELGSVLRSTKVTNSLGQVVSLGDCMGPQSSVVIFLRHMG